MTPAPDGSQIAAPVLPGLHFDQRTALFEELIALDLTARPVLDAVVGDRACVLLTDPGAVQTLLRSDAPKGRPRATVVGVPGYMSAVDEARRAARAAVKTALGAASVTAPDVRSDPDVAVAVMAHLSGAEIGPELRALTDQTRATVRELVDNIPGATSDKVTSPDVLEGMLQPCAFVDELRGRGWSDLAIAGEVVTLTFAGWASMAAVLTTARTLGVGGASTTAAHIDELLRIAPPGWLITRETQTPTVLAGNQIPAGTLVLTSPWLLHRSRDEWNYPEKFDPQRSNTRRSAAYLPFSLGEWACPAERYSRAILQELLRREAPATAASQPKPALIDGRSACLVAVQGVVG